MAYHYRVPTVGAGVQGDPERPAHQDDLDVDPAAYNRHYRGDMVVIASAVPVETYEELSEDTDSPVVAMGDVGEDEYPTPDYGASDENDGSDGDDADREVYVCEEDDCGEEFASQGALNGHMSAHSR